MEQTFDDKLEFWLGGRGRMELEKRSKKLGVPFSNIVRLSLATCSIKKILQKVENEKYKNVEKNFACLVIVQISSIEKLRLKGVAEKLGFSNFSKFLRLALASSFLMELINKNEVENLKILGNENFLINK